MEKMEKLELRYDLNTTFVLNFIKENSKADSNILISTLREVQGLQDHREMLAKMGRRYVSLANIYVVDKLFTTQT